MAMLRYRTHSNQLPPVKTLQPTVGDSRVMLVLLNVHLPLQGSEHQ